VQGGHDYFRFVEGTCRIALCLSSLSLSVLSTAFRIWTSLQKLYSNCFWSVISVGEIEEKVNTIQPPAPPFLYFSHLQSPWTHFKKKKYWANSQLHYTRTRTRVRKQHFFISLSLSLSLLVSALSLNSLSMVANLFSFTLNHKHSDGFKIYWFNE